MTSEQCLADLIALIQSPPPDAWERLNTSIDAYLAGEADVFTATQQLANDLQAKAPDTELRIRLLEKLLLDRELQTPSSETR